MGDFHTADRSAARLPSWMRPAGFGHHQYLAGLVPLSAQIGNTISNDGDALFPAIAIAPKVAIVATLYSAVPAIMIAYGWMYCME